MKIEQQFRELVSAVEDAGTLAREYFTSNRRDNTEKRDGTVVTEVDQKIEAVLLDFVRAHFPDDAIVGEEHGSKEGTSQFVWHIDPIDGTDNFLRKIPFCAISVARLGDSLEDSFGIVHNPLTGQTFASLMDEGVYENEHLAVFTKEPLGGRYVISIGRGSAEPWMRPAGYALQEGLGMKYGKCLGYGSTALELAYIAANRIDGYLTYGLHSYDYAAGLFLVNAVGGAISVFEDGKWKRWEGSLKALCSVHGRVMFASHPDIHEDITSFIGDPKRWAERTGNTIS